MLIVDGSPTLRHMIRAILTADPELRVEGETHNGEEAVAMAGRAQWVMAFL